MKKYVKPQLEYIEIKAEERLAAVCVTPGSCPPNETQSFTLS